MTLPGSLNAEIAKLLADVGELVESRKALRGDATRFAKYANDPAGFSREVLQSRLLWSKQEELLELVRDRSLVTCRGANGAGKDYAAAHLALWWVFAKGGYVLATAPTARQSDEIFMGEVGRAWRLAQLPGELRTRGLRIQTNGSHLTGILSLTSSESSRLTGHHAPLVMVILSEAQGLEPFVWESAFSIAVSEEDRIVAIGNPTESQGRFYESFKPGGAWATLQISAFDHPNVVEGRQVIPGAVSRRMIDAFAADYGVDSAAYQARVLAEFPVNGDEDALIRPKWLEAAVARWGTADTLELANGRDWEASLDVARGGADSSVLVVKRGPMVYLPVSWSGCDLMTTVGKVLTTLQERGTPLRQYNVAIPYKRSSVLCDRLMVDMIGIGSGVLDRLTEQGYAVEGFNGSQAPKVAKQDPKLYLNLRAYAYWQLRGELEAGTIALPNDPKLLEELAATRWRANSAGKIQIEDKDALKSRIGRSPDRADALAMLFGRQESFFRVYDHIEGYRL